MLRYQIKLFQDMLDDPLGTHICWLFIFSSKHELQAIYDLKFIASVGKTLLMQKIVDLENTIGILKPY